jgi:hypothetical protein
VYTDLRDPSRWRVWFPPHPQRWKESFGVGFWVGAPVGTLLGRSTGQPVLWRDGQPELITAEALKHVDVRGARQDLMVGNWHTPSSYKYRALAWIGGGKPVSLHPDGWEWTVGVGCGDGQFVGCGKKDKASKGGALLWNNSEAEPVLLGPGAEAVAACQGVQVGHYGGPGFQQACLWRGTSHSRLDLHPEGPSQALGVGDGQQVGVVWRNLKQPRAALWQGQAAFVDLTPAGYEYAKAQDCTAGMQVGYAGRDGRTRAMLWNGTAESAIDLQDLVPPPWQDSTARCIEIRQGKVCIIGQAVDQTVCWEAMLSSL